MNYNLSRIIKTNSHWKMQLFSKKLWQVELKGAQCNLGSCKKGLLPCALKIFSPVFSLGKGAPMICWSQNWKIHSSYMFHIFQRCLQMTPKIYSHPPARVIPTPLLHQHWCRTELLNHERSERRSAKGGKCIKGIYSVTIVTMICYIPGKAWSKSRFNHGSKMVFKIWIHVNPLQPRYTLHVLAKQLEKSSVETPIWVDFGWNVKSCRFLPNVAGFFGISFKVAK